MYDRRIVRGNTYAQHTLPAVSTYMPCCRVTGFHASPVSLHLIDAIALYNLGALKNKE